MKGIYVLWLRDLKRYTRARSRFFGSLAMPFFFLAFFGLGFRRVTFPSIEIGYMEFLTPGIVSMVVIFSGTLSGVSVVWDRQFGFLREIMVSPVSRSAIVLGRTLGGATIATIQATILAAISHFLGFSMEPSMIPVALLAIFVFSIISTLTGIAISSVITDIHGFQLIVNFFVFPIFFLSGAIFPVSEFPGIVETIARLSPFTYGVDLVRFSMVNLSLFDPLVDVIVIFLYLFLMLSIASYLFSRTEVR
ncbi:MAG: ABC transporter permease [Archaeoglobales archaeon]|nr:ABC transporter permease [Archaeoglobales archaeon]